MPTDLQLVEVRAETLRALHAGRADWAASQPELAGISWPDDDRRMPRYRVAALDADPSAAPYLLHVALAGDGRFLGRIGCHAAPDDAGEVEIGYYVMPAQRGRGVAGKVVDEFLRWLRVRGVAVVRATVGPTNEHSRKILHRRGFVEVGTQVDEEDGVELIYRLILEPAPAGRT